jgi:hypothetical protein
MLGFVYELRLAAKSRAQREFQLETVCSASLEIMCFLTLETNVERLIQEFFAERLERQHRARAFNARNLS